MTTTSTWDIHLQKQMPCIVTIHTGMSANDYSAHFDSDNKTLDNSKIKCLGVYFGYLHYILSTQLTCLGHFIMDGCKVLKKCVIVSAK